MWSECTRKCSVAVKAYTERYTNIKEELNLKLNKGSSPLGTKPHPVKIEDLTNFMS